MKAINYYELRSILEKNLKSSALSYQVLLANKKHEYLIDSSFTNNTEDLIEEIEKFFIITPKPESEIVDE